MRIQCTAPDCGRAATYSGSKGSQRRQAANGGWSRGPGGTLCGTHGTAPFTKRRVRPVFVFALILAVSAVLLILGSR